MNVGYVIYKGLAFAKEITNLLKSCWRAVNGNRIELFVI